MRRIIIRLCGLYTIVVFLYGITIEIPNGRNFTTEDIVLMTAGLLIWLSGEWSWYKDRKNSRKSYESRKP